MKQSAMALWWNLVFEISFSAMVGFLFIAGTAMVATKSVVLGVGSGMVMAAVCMVAVFRRSPLSKGLIVVLPAAEAAKEMESNLQTIERR
ncbi:MAG: hypothetical protein CXZ00_15495 [Acidobacteria bacterium]|nr:MAG: hypothetical protein CXZ00_15495 [Acidobacteriota bacterium]